MCYLLTLWNRVLLEKLTGSVASQEIPRVFGTRRFLTVPTSARHLSLSWANSIQSPQLPPTSWRSILIGKDCVAYLFETFETLRHYRRHRIRHSQDRASWYILIMRGNEMCYFSDLFHKVLYMFRTGPLSIIRSISTLYTCNRYLPC